MTGIENRQHLWAHNRDAAMMALAQVPNLDPSKHMIVVADAQDTVGAALLEALGTPEGAADMTRIAARGDIPTLVAVLPVEAVARVIRSVNPNVARSLETLPLAPGGIWALVIGNEGSMLLQTPMIVAPSVGSG